VQLQSLRAFVTEDNPQYKAVLDQLEALKSQLAKVNGPNADSVTDFSVSGTKIPEKGMVYLDAVRDVRYYETIDELIAKQFELAKLDEARQGVIQISDVAIPPDRKSSPYRALNVVLMTFIAFIVSVLWVLSANRWEQAKRNPEKSVKIETLRRALTSNWR
jgi:capsule polysaccharide export protein KpsE/RkpR